MKNLIEVAGAEKKYGKNGDFLDVFSESSCN